MSYTRPAASAADFAFSGSVYTRPTGGAHSFTFPPSTYSGTGAVTLDFSAAAVAEHGVAGSGALTLDISAAAVGDHDSFFRTGVGAVSLDISADVAGAHGVAGSGAVTLNLAADGTAEHGVAATGAAATLTITAAATGAHGVAGSASCTLGLTAAAVGVHERYEVRGEVRLEGVLVNRQVRVYLRSTGALIGDEATAVGKFHVHCGFAAAEHYIVPVHLDVAASDWSPPTANRVLSVLAEDA